MFNTIKDNVLFLIIGVLLAAVFGMALYLVPKVENHTDTIDMQNRNISAIVEFLKTQQQ